MIDILLITFTLLYIFEIGIFLYGLRLTAYPRRQDELPHV